MFHSKIFDYMESKKLTKRKKKADKPKKQKYIEELNRQIAYVLDNVKETIITENTNKPISISVLKQYFLPKGWF